MSMFDAAAVSTNEGGRVLRQRMREPVAAVSTSAAPTSRSSPSTATGQSSRERAEPRHAIPRGSPSRERAVRHRRAAGRRGMRGRVRGPRLCTVGVGEDGMLLDADLRPLTSALAWFDQRRQGILRVCAHSSPTTRRSTSPVTLLAPSSVGCGAQQPGSEAAGDGSRLPTCPPCCGPSYLSQRHPRLTNRCVAGQQPSMGTDRVAVARVRRAAAGGDVGRRHRREGDVAVPAVGRLDRRRRDRCRRRT